ncbi:hypothetical protein C5S30_04100 [ANME-1 cluster archaeon GoMg4]|nr:hypothetical protein [ANME-1 cluster archaeon GoMg4]
MEMNAIPEGFKMTELGPLPEGWDVLRLKDLAEKMKAGGTPSRKEPKYWGDDIPFVLIKDMTSCGLYLSNTKEKITEEGLKDSNTWVVPPNSLLLSMYATIGETAINTIPLTTNQAILAIIPKSNFDIVFGAYLIKFHANRLIMENVQSTQKNVNKGIVENFKIPLPPLSEQQKIAKVLSTVQEAKEKSDAVIIATKELKKSLLHKLFTEGLNGEEQKETEIGLIPEGWEVVGLGGVCKQRKEQILPTGEGKFRYIGLEHIDSGETRLKRFGYDNEVRSSKYEFYAGDMLYGKLRPYLDKAIKADFEGICSTDIIVITVDESKIIADYLVNLLHLPFFVHYATSTMTGVNHPRTSWRAISVFKIPLPFLEEQQQIAHILSTVDKKIEIEKGRKTTLKELFKTMLHKLMTGEKRLKEVEI